MAEAPLSAAGLVLRMCRCEYEAVAEFVELQSGEQREALLTACGVVGRAIYRARWIDVEAMLRYRLPADPRSYRAADPARLRQLLEAGSAGDDEGAWHCVAELALPDLDAYGYVVGIARVLVERLARS